MNIEWSVVQSLISAGAALAGVWWGGRLTWRREEAREQERAKKESSYLAILVVAHLDRMANACLQVALDDGTEDGRPAGGNGCWWPVVPAPTFDPLAFNVDWKALPANLMYDILGMPYRMEQLEHHINGTLQFDDPPEYAEFFWARQSGYASLGLEFSQLARKLREHAALPFPPADTGGWSRDDELRKVVDRVAAERAAYEARSAVVAILPVGN